MRVGAQVHYVFTVFKKYAIINRKRLNRIFATILTILTVISFVPLFSDKWREIFLNFFSGLINRLPNFLSFFYDPRALVLYVIALLTWMGLIYYKYEVRFLELALKNKRELAMELPAIKNAVPNNHYLGLILGKLNEKALEIKDRKGPEIISSIDKNIKKYEKVYWVSEDEIGIIFYELNTKDENDFITYVVRNKLKSEIGEANASTFLNNIRFVMVKIDQAEELFNIESKARIRLIREQANANGEADTLEPKKELIKEAKAPATT